MTHPTRPYVFIVGAPRSGTTLLRRLLSHHPELAIPHELRLLDLASSIGWSVNHDGRPHTPLHDHASALDLAWGKPLVDRVMARLAEHTGARVVGDKYPPDSARIPMLDAVFAACQIIHIVRDGRDVVSSSLRAFAVHKAWRRSPTPLRPVDMAASWTRAVTTARRDGPALGRGRYLELSYEALTTQPEATGQAVLQFLKVGSHPAFTEALQTVRAGRSWRTTLSEAEQHALASIPDFEAALADAGYPASPELPRSVDTPAACMRRAEEGPADQRVAELCRAVRPEAAPDVAIQALLAESTQPESLFAAMNARERSSPEVRAAYARWMAERGLPPHLADRIAGVS